MGANPRVRGSMYFLPVSLFLFIQVSAAGVGSVVSAPSQSDAVIVNNKKTTAVKQGQAINLGDVISSRKTPVELKVGSFIKVVMKKDSQISIIKLDKAVSDISYVKGVVEFKINSKTSPKLINRILGNSVTFAGVDSEFTLVSFPDGVDLYVAKGEMEVSSPYIQTFVPEIVKAKEGFRFNRKKRTFERKKFQAKI